MSRMVHAANISISTHKLVSNNHWKDPSKEHSPDHFEEHSKDHSKKHSKDYSKEHLKYHSKSYARSDFLPANQELYVFTSLVLPNTGREIDSGSPLARS